MFKPTRNAAMFAAWLLLLLNVVTAASGQSFFFTCNSHTDYTSNVCNDLSKQLLIGSLRTVGDISINDERASGPNWLLTMRINNRVVVNYQYTPSRIHRYLSSEELAQGLLRRLQTERKLAKTNK